MSFPNTTERRLILCDYIFESIKKRNVSLVRIDLLHTMGYKTVKVGRCVPGAAERLERAAKGGRRAENLETRYRKLVEMRKRDGKK